MFKMEKHIKRQDSNIQFNRHVPGCFWSIFHTIDYHPWHNVKKMLPYRRHSKSKGSPKSTMNNHHVAEATEQINDENKPLWCTAESCPIGSKPGEGYVNEVISKEISEEESQNYWKINSNSKRSLSRTQSIHHLESSSYYSRHISPMELGAPGIKSNSLNAMDSENYFTRRKIDTQLTSFTEQSNGVRKTLESKQIDRNILSHSFKEDVHIQEIFKANRKLFAELLQGAQSKKTLQTPQNKKSSASLAKSRSFPAPGLARKGYKKLSSLQHKQNESFPKVRKSDSPQPSKLVESESPKNFHEDVMPCDSDSTSSSNITSQTSSSSFGPNRGLRHGGWNQLVVKRFNFIKQKIRHSFKERKKGNNQKTSKGTPTQTVDPSGHELPLSREEAQESLGTATSNDGLGIRGYSETGNSENDNLSDGVQTKTGTASLERYSKLSDGSSVRGYSVAYSSENVYLSIGVQTKTGTASLKAPLERYSQQPEREAKCFHSQSLRLIREETIPNIEKRRKSYGRNLSLPDIDLFCTLFTDPSPAVSRTEKPKRGVVHSSTDNNMRIDENPAHLLNEVISEPLDSDSQSVVEKSDDNMPVDYSGSLNEVKNDEGAAWADKLEEKIPHLDFSDGEHHQVLGSECVIEDVDVSETVDQVGALSPTVDQVSETCLRDDETSKLSDSEGSILNRRCSAANELEPSDDQPKEASAEALSASETIVNHEIIDAEKISNYLYLNSELGRINNADFNYMRYILQLSSFIESGHTIDRPLSSSIFEGEEAQFYKKLECYWEKVDKDSDHQLLHDLVYETSHNVFEKSFTSFLKTFSSRTQIRPMPLGQYLLEDVREKVAWYLCLGPELDQSLDDVVGRDLRKGDDWMNLQTEIEYNALELEDLILDELLEEVISF
ncbi:uncharacterized protein LOC111448443 isoform X2 [Cucurbita moschata]|uniref:Uncharacterized protein LOC111448443 isoform X1 n=1 Tax=Cucurbita moschata TaxID=3662 RepID=A0A6J1FYA4_CUCMO|nr:uncharacterized protein LOC111448443 isoform X1 [Cucurbita moschata]XP_022943806.1 uncharacterized protein LOC111448443 isoform X1 [Cucurbita moschata]XP_022943808.1 uncharacterized protein LOC111448443 isoform X1 [Cucurbita moschata]XP_022943809.1 uncharacterized protein LOC111448443 isoform X1 [Cucurbita moschata]XP_022943810.1 uncharacterized protein LOC111448443 isoform X1 [Cucurbita moschata]XP_022943811.1 uncharacterized protein LOC111448443 isoform X1 [Cucurbita moschata]XP_02294381